MCLAVEITNIRSYSVTWILPGLKCCEKRTDEHEQSSWWTEHVCLHREPRKGFKRQLLAESQSVSHSARLLFVSLLMLNTVVMLNMYLKTFFRILWWILCSNQLHNFLLNKGINIYFFLLTPNFWTVEQYFIYSSLDIRLLSSLMLFNINCNLTNYV